MTRITESLIIKGTPAELYQKWMQIDKFPRFLKNIKSVDMINNETSHWVVRGPAGKEYEFDTLITKDDPNQRIGWRTVKGDLQIHGQVAFAPLPDDQTEVSVIMHVEPPGGDIGEGLMNALGDPHAVLYRAMTNFKEYVEGMPERLPDQD